MPLDPETDRIVWAFAKRIADLPTNEQADATVVAISALLSSQSPETIDIVFAAMKALLGDFQRSDSFKRKHGRPS